MAAVEAEMSKTYQYRKVMKPMLERKRRARINKCLDELKELMVTTLESEGEHVTRLEKADILELTVNHLRKLKKQNKLRLHQQTNQAEGFRTGYMYAAQEVSRTLSQCPGGSVNLGSQLMTHLGQCLNQIQSPSVKVPLSMPVPVTMPVPVPLSAPVSMSMPLSLPIGNPLSGHNGYSPPSFNMPLSPVSSRASFSGSPPAPSGAFRPTMSYSDIKQPDDPVWRPW